MTLARLSGVSPREKVRLCSIFDSEDGLAGKSAGEIEAVLGRRLSKPWNLDEARALAERDERAAKLRGIGWVSWRNPSYPPLLREIYDPPVVLFFRGRLPDAERPLAAVVGTRRPSPQAAAQAFSVSRDLAAGGVSVVSGLALGVDAMAHRGCVEGGLPTFAVLGSAVDEVYPASNRQLARSVISSGGALISEYPPGSPPRKWNFPARNRIVSGLSRGVLIVQAPEKSGALITARFALEQNRELWVASCGAGETGGPDSVGTARLAEQGAEVVYSASDILGMWDMKAEGGESGEDPASMLARSLGITL